MELPATLKVYQPEIVEELKQVLGGGKLPLYDMMRYHLGWADEKGQPPPVSRGQPQRAGGKLLRSSLCLCVCQAVGGDWHQALPAAAAVELVHNFSLIHDDIEDESATRRHRPTVWQVWGPAQAINAGDAMHALARLALLRMEKRGVPARKVLEAIHIIDDATLRLCEGQFRDIDYEGRLDLKLGEYLEMASAKTAALFQAACHLGALIGTDDERKVAALCQFGEDVGLAFQIRDDVLGIWGEAEATGKPPGSDIRERKKSLPIVYALKKARGEQRAPLRQLWRQKTVSDKLVNAVISVLDDLGAQDYCQKQAEQYKQRALSELDKASLSQKSRQVLADVADFMVKRRS